MYSEDSCVVQDYKSCTAWKEKIYIGLFFTWLGDWCLLKNDFISFYSKYQGDIYLISGCILLLAGFLMYTLLFKKMCVLNIKDCQEAFLAFLSMTFVSIVFYQVISVAEIGVFKYIVLFGSIIMTSMMVFAANVHHDKIRRNISIQFLIPGTITLVITMGIIVAHRFLLQEADFLAAVIELTYGFGQMLILRGFTKYLKA